ncbi:hypothetical protein C2E23DRAFT_866429 [Lenzites betulinus]|nr:hypothetical protein C2E23DRAFT_866429 [Lenzites betulinus]
MDRREAPPTQLAECAKCGGRIRDNPQGRHTLYRCIDCHQVGERCVDCIIASHEERPFDRIRMWNEDLGFWEKTNIAELGFVWSLGHGGTACPRNHSPSRAMVFLHEHGIMDLKVKFCACLNADSDAAQLIEHGCWPATWHTPHTAFSLTAMATFHGLELQATVNVHDYVKLLCRMTDGIAPDNVKDRYREFNSSMREYRQVRARRRGGVEMHATPKSGELAVLCPACPQPGINMRPGWRERKHPYRYIDALTYSIDGNFHLGSKAKETDEADVALSEGAGYFVNSKDFKTYLEKAPEPPAEPTTCNQFGAMGTGKYKGKISGVIAITCRHMFLLPGGIVDLQLGEKHRFVDFALVSAMQRYLSLRLLVGTYDIHCQYIRHLRKRLREQFGEVIEELDSIQSSELPAIVAGVGKYHLAMHKGECRHRHSLHYLPGSCMTDGEMLERIWAVMNTVARRTKEMSAGHRQDVLNDHYSDQNVRRVHSMVPELVEKLRVADEMAHVSTEYIQCVEKTINPHDLATWREAEEEWKEKVVDITQHNGLPNPYEPPQDATLTSQAILAQLQQERLAEGQSGPTADVNVVHTVMELRDESERLRAQVIAHNGSETERSRLALRLENYRERAAACREKYMSTIQVAVDSAMAEVVPKESSEAFPNRDDIDDLEKGIPVLASSKGKAVDGSSRTPPRRSRVIEEMLTILDEGTFRLPSDCHSAVREHKSMAPFTRLERALREGQANEALDVLRLHLTTHLALTVRKQEGAGVIHNTAADRRLQEKRDVIDKWKEKYRHLRLLLLVLGMSDDDNTYRRLNDDDCKAFTLLVSEQKLGDSFKKPTWIWGDFGWAEKLEQGEIREFVGHAMRAHWFRHNALRTRWEEEVNVRLEEMWRTLAFFEHMERTWLVRADVMASKGTALAGACVSARRQAHRWTRLRHRAEQAFPRTIDQVRVISWSTKTI